MSKTSTDYIKALPADRQKLYRLASLRYVHEPETDAMICRRVPQTCQIGIGHGQVLCAFQENGSDSLCIDR